MFDTPTKAELQLLKKKLPHGFGELLHQRTKIPTTYIYQLLGGGYKIPLKLIDAAIELAEETKQKKAALKRIISED